MAKYFIFNKDAAAENGALFRAAESDTALQNLNINQDLYKVLNSTDAVYTNFQKGLYIDIKYDDSDTILYTDISSTVSFVDADHLNSEINAYKDQINHWLVRNKNHTDFNKWNTFKNNIAAIDASSKTRVSSDFSGSSGLIFKIIPAFSRMFL